MPLDYDMPLFRPPSEANSLIIQATIGCSHNRCYFCGMYKMKKFRIRSFAEIEADIEDAVRAWPDATRIFLADGDALIIKTPVLLKILKLLHSKFPLLERVTLYANPGNLLIKSEDELRQLKENGLKILYYGVESGDDEFLKRVDKGATTEQMIEGCRKATNAGLELSVTVLLGLGGKSGSQRHILKTAEVCSKIDPRYIGALTLMLGPFEDTFGKEVGGDWQPIDKKESLQELRLLVENLDVQNCIFRSNHASNYLPIGGNLPQDKDRMLKLIDRAMTDSSYLRPEFLRGL
ncbi:MAG: B12-binding domain-containing radical SAM protein [Deltaproteobacteria bacterium]|nr:MAG: B12-binding domain-containing radical SAM protein [Deltaproteobacteria bacterium]